MNVVSKIRAPRKASASVTKKRVRDAKGKAVDFFVVDGTSPRLGDDLTYVFTKNIERARDENRKLFGSADGRAKK